VHGAQLERPTERTGTLIAVLIPCYNEAIAIAKVVSDFRQALPEAAIFVYDNNSTDRTVDVARRAGAVVRSEPMQGKGNVVRRMLAEIEADVYVLVDGDDTYEAAAARRMVNELREKRLDMVVGIRKEAEPGGEAYRRGHAWGNKAFNGVFAACFGNTFSDIFSGYRVFSRRFVKSFPALSSGFEIETEMSIHALELRLPSAEVPTQYFARPVGSESKLNTYRDGLRILGSMLRLFKQVAPFRFFGGISLAGGVLSLALGLPVIYEFIQTGLVPRFPTAILASGIMVLSGVAFITGVITESISHGRVEQKRLQYNVLPVPDWITRGDGS
jgi:glycosyltransferase involved in cell wall biosynthesis